MGGTGDCPSLLAETTVEHGDTCSPEQDLGGLDPDASTESDIRVEELPDQDWNRQWAQSVRPIRIGRRIVIRPSWEPVALRAQDIEIVLDPKQAFGTDVIGMA